jgi:hypothetical protein
MFARGLKRALKRPGLDIAPSASRLSKDAHPKGTSAIYRLGDFLNDEPFVPIRLRF